MCLGFVNFTVTVDIHQHDLVLLCFFTKLSVVLSLSVCFLLIDNTSAIEMSVQFTDAGRVE